MKMIIHIKTNLLTLLMLCLVCAVLVILLCTNVPRNLMFCTLRTDAIESVELYDYQGETIQLLEEDIIELVMLLRQVRVKGESFLTWTAVNAAPFFRICLKNGHTFTLGCDYQDAACYIIDGRSYYASGELDDLGVNVAYKAIRQWHDQLVGSRRKAG